MFGLVGNEATALPHKRMLSSMTPTIVERTESFYDRWFPWTIITSVLQTILNVYEYKHAGSG
jgi:gamma-glutamyltranspeptidase/glutathione hydrolase